MFPDDFFTGDFFSDHDHFPETAGPAITASAHKSSGNIARARRHRHRMIILFALLGGLIH